MMYRVYIHMVTPYSFKLFRNYRTNVLVSQDESLTWNGVESMACVGQPPNRIMSNEAIMRWAVPDLVVLRQGPRK